MELPQLVVELVGDYSKLMEDIKRARVEAVKQAQFLEKDLNLTIGVNDKKLSELNKHFDLKVTHFKQTQTYFKNNPLKVYVDDRELTNLNKEFKKSSITKQKVTRVVEVDETVVNNNKKPSGSNSNNNGNNSDSGGKKESTKDVVDELKKGFADIRKQIRDQATGEVLKILAKPAKDFMTGFSEGIANDFGKQVSKGLRTVFAKQLGLDFKKMGEMAGESLLDAFGIKRKKTTKEKPPTSTTPENNSSVGEPLAKSSPKKKKEPEPEPEPVFEKNSVRFAKQNALNFSNIVRNAATVNNNVNPREISSTVLSIKSAHQSLHKVLIDLMKNASNSGDFSIVEKIYKEYQIKSKEALAEINRLIALAKKNGATQEEINKLSQAKSPITRAAGKSSQLSQTYQKTKRESEKFETVKDAATGMGLDAIAGLKYGLDNKAFAKFGLQNATAYLLSIRDAFQIKSPSKVMFSIGKNIIQGLIGGLDQAFPGVQAQVKKLFDSLTKDFLGFKLSRLFDSGISGAIKYLATSAKKTIFSNLTDTIGDFAEEKLKPSVANFIKNSANKTKSSGKNTLLDYIKGLVGDTGSLISNNKDVVKDFFTAKNFLNLGSKAAPFAINSVIKKSESLKNILGLAGIDSEKVNIGKDISDYFGDLINKTFKPIINAQSGKLKSATIDFFQTIKNNLNTASNTAELTLGELFANLAASGTGSILSSLGVDVGKGDFLSAFINMLSGGSKGGFVSKLLPLIVPALGLKSLNLGDIIVKILSGNSAIKPGFLMDVFRSITGVNLKQTPVHKAMSGIIVGVSSEPKERLELENVNNKQIQENLKNINLSGGTTGLINNFGQTIIKEVLKNLGITGIKAGVMQGMANEQLAKFAPEISKMLGKGRLKKLISGYTTGDVDSISQELNDFAQSKGIKNLDVSQIKGFVGIALAAITGLQARFNKEGFALGNNLAEGFKDSKRNWLNSIDDAAYAAKKALGQANMQDVGENVKKRMSRGSVIPVEMFDEFYGHLGRTVKKAIAPKNYSKEQQDSLGDDAAGSAFSQAALLVPIQTMASAIAPLFLPLLPIIQTAKMMADSLFPYVNKLVDMAQRAEPIQRQLNFAGGGSLGGKAELDYVRSVGKKYSTSVEFGAGAYGQLQVAARGTKMAGEGVRELYEGISASLNKLGIAGQEQSLVFMAYTQMLAKGRVSMEELRQQLSEKFPPAMSVFAKAMGLSIPAMVEMVSNGGVLSDEILPKVGRVLLQEFGGATNSVNSVIDALARLSNAGFDIAVGLTESFGGAMAGAINILTGGLNVISNSISKISSIVSTSLITMVIATTVGLKTVLRQNPIANAVSTLQNFLMSSFKNMTMALAPFILGMVVDFGDTMIGAQKDIGDNIAMGLTNMFRGAAGVLENLKRSWTGLPLFGDVIGKEEGKNPLSGLIDGVKSLTKILPSGVVELGALTFMLQSLGVLLKAHIFDGLGSAIGGMIGAVSGAVTNLATTMSGLRVLFANTSTMNFGDFAKREAMINAAMGARVALMEKLRVAAMALSSVMVTVGAAFLLLSFAKGDFTNPLGDSVSEMAKGVNDSIKTMKSSLAELAEKFKSVGDSAENAAKKFIQLPSKGAELNPQYLLGLGGKSIKFDDVVNKGDKQDGLRSNLSAFFTNIFTPVDESKTPVLRVWDKVKPLFGQRNQQKDVKKALAEAKSYGIEEFFTGKESFLNISKSQTLGTFRDVRSSVKGFEKELSNLGLLGGEKELLAKNKDLGRQINIIKDIDKKLITLGKERQVLAQRRDSKSIIKVGELDKEAVDLQVQRDKELKPLSRFSSAAEQAKTFVKDLREEINKSTAPLQLKIKLLDEIKPLEDFAKKASENVKKYFPVNFAENNYKELAAGLKDAQINYEAAKNNAEINLSGRQKDLYSSGKMPGDVSYESNLAQIAEQETQAKNLSTILSIRMKSLIEMSAIINVDREQDQKKEMDDLKKQIADDTVNLGRLTSDIAKGKFDLTQSLYQQTKQVTDYYRVAVRESQAVGIEFEKAQKTLENPKVQNKLREALIGAGDNIYTQFIEGIINVISQTTEIEKQQLEARKQRIDYQNNVQDIQLQAVELQRSLPGKIIPIDSSIADNFNLSLKNVNSTVDEINKNINNLSNSVVDATKKADDSIKDLSKTSNSWIEGLGTKFADLVKSFENGFDRVGTAIIGMGLKTSNWLASLATGQGLIQNLAGGISAVFGEKSGQQLEQGAKEFVSNPLGALKKFYGLDNNSTPSTRLKTKGKVGFVENSSSSIDSARGHIGDDIFAPIGSKIFSPLAGTVVQSRVGGTKNTDDANPLVPGYQPQQLVIIKLDMPIEFEGKKITHLNMRHLLDRNVQVGQKVKMGDLLGTVGEAGGRGTQFGTRNPGTARDADAAHLHIEYATSENNQRNSLPDSQASRLTAKLSKEYSGGVQNTVNTPKTSRNRQLVPKVPPVPGLDPRIDTKFLQSVATIAQSVGAKPEDLLKTMLYETGGTLSPSARNSRTKATGLIQFMPATARGLGTNIDALAQMSPQEQLVFVQKYLKQNSRGQKLDSFRKVLSTIFAGNPNASLGVGDGDITLGSYLKKAEGRYGNTARQLEQIVMQGKLIDPNSQQKLVTQASRLKLKTAAQQYQTNQTNNNLSPEQIRENELKQRLEAYRLIMSSKKTALGEISSTKDSTLGTSRTVLEGLSPNMSNAGRFSLQLDDLRRKLEKDVEALEQVIRETNGAIAQKPDLQAAFNLAMKRFPNDPKLAADAIQTNDLNFKATAFKNAEAKNNLAFLKSNIGGILKASMEDFDKKEFLRLREQDVSQQSKVIEQLQQQLQLVQKLEETDPLNPLVLNIPSLQRNISLLELTRDQYQQLVDLQKRYYEGGSKGGNMSEEALQKEFKAIFDVNSVKKEGVGLNFKYADTVRQIKYATDKLTKAQTIQASQMKSLQLDNERFAIDNKDGMVSLVSLTNELTIKTNELTDAYKKQLLEIQGNTLLSPQEKLIERLKALRNYGKGKSNLEAENSYQTKLAPITNRGIELGRMEKLISSENAVSSEVMRGQGLFGIRNKELQKTQALSQIKTDFEKEKIEIHKLGLSSNYSAEEIQKLTDNLNKLNELKLDNVAKEFNMFTEAISGIKGDFDNIIKGFIMNDSVSKNAGDLQDINKSLDDIAKKRRDIIINTSGNIQEVRNAYQNSGNNERLKELDRAQKDLEKKKTELDKRSIVDSFIEIGKSILSNLASVASKELSNQLFSKLNELIFGNKAKDVGAMALNNAGANLNTSATMLQNAALALQNITGAGSKKDGGVTDSIFGAFGESSFGILEGSSAPAFSSSGAFDFSDGFSLGSGLDFGSAELPSFAKGGMVGDLLNKERAISGFNPRLIIANEGERVLTPAETKLWNQLNSSNKLESFSSGGMVGQGLGNINNVGRSGDTINITPNVNINNEGGGNINKALFEKALEAKIQETIKQERRPGGSLNRGGLYDR